MKPASGLRTLLAVLVLGSAGCGWWYNDVPSPDDLWHRVPWFDHMLGSRAVYPYSSAAVPRITVAGTVPVGGTEVDYFSDWQRGNTDRANSLLSPTTDLTASLARGDTLFHTFCLTCHGQTGIGDGPVGRKIGSLSLVSARAQGLSDGYIYSMIRYGRGIMGQYGDKIYRPEDRWAVVNYVRHLQQQAAAPELPQ